MSTINQTTNNNTYVRTFSIRAHRIPVIALLLITLISGASAQQGSVSVIAPNGMRVSVPIVIRPGLGDIARGGNGMVAIDPMLLQTRWEFQQFVLAHEAAHAIGIMDEAAADYYAGQMLRIAGFGSNQMQVVFASMAAFLGSWGDATHLPAQSRIQVVMSAYSGR